MDEGNISIKTKTFQIIFLFLGWILCRKRKQILLGKRGFIIISCPTTLRPKGLLKIESPIEPVGQSAALFCPYRFHKFNGASG